MLNWWPTGCYTRAYTLDNKHDARASWCCCARNALEDPWVEAREDMFTRSVSPEQAPDQPTYLNLEFERGDPVALDGMSMTPANLLAALNKARPAAAPPAACIAYACSIGAVCATLLHADQSTLTEQPCCTLFAAVEPAQTAVSALHSCEVNSSCDSGAGRGRQRHRARGHRGEPLCGHEVARRVRDARRHGACTPCLQKLHCTALLRMLCSCSGPLRLGSVSPT
jgi:hypothetical protein